MPTYRYLEPPSARQCTQCHTMKPAADCFDWKHGWPRSYCKDCRRDNDRARYARKVSAPAGRDHINAQRRDRYARAKVNAAWLAFYSALPEAERARLDEGLRKTQEALKAAATLRDHRLAYGRWREREIREGRMQRPPNINPFTGKPRPTDDEKASKLASRAENGPRAAPPRWAALMAESDRLAALRRHRNASK